MTVSFGSVLAGTVLDSDVTLWQGTLAMGALFAVQWGIGWLRSRFSFVERAADNRPVLLMRDGEVLEANLARTRVTMDDLRAKLREANGLDLGQVRAVVLKTTGDGSVLHGDHLSVDLMRGVAD